MQKYFKQYFLLYLHRNPSVALPLGLGLPLQLQHLILPCRGCVPQVEVGLRRGLGPGLGDGAVLHGLHGGHRAGVREDVLANLPVENISFNCLKIFIVTWARRGMSQWARGWGG